MMRMIRILQQEFVRTHRTHAIVQSVATAGGFALNVVDRRRMYHRARRPCAAIESGHGCNRLELLRSFAAKRAGSRTWGKLGNVIPSDYPRTRDRILAKFHR